MPHRLLVVDDDPTIRAALGDALGSAGFVVDLVDGPTAALASIGRALPDVMLCDVRMPEISGLELLRLVRERAPALPVVLMTAYDDMSTVVEAMKAGAVEFLVKPLDLDDVLRTLERVIDDAQTRRRTRGVAGEPLANGLVGRTPNMIEVYKLLGQAATTRATVLVRGESGTGKELVARAIHEHSSASAEPFVPVNCAALPQTLLESELFGHVRGAFTGAANSRRGRFALAGKGTIFLDEIGDTPLDFQTKLLRVLQDREYQPVGSDDTEHTEARVIAATHQDLETLIAERRFRQDLYYRLRVVEIVLPPLRDRLADIPLLADHILARAAVAMQAPQAVLSPDALAHLMQHRWPGNVRELENCLMRALVVASGGVIRPEHVASLPPQAAASERVPSLTDLEREHVTRVLEMAHGHKGRAAELLGVSRPRLNRLIEKYGLT